MEAEYISCSATVSEAVWIKRFVDSVKLGIPNRPVNVFCDNKSTISLIKSGANSSKGKHIEKNYHYIQDVVERGWNTSPVYSLKRDGGWSHNQMIDFK